MWPNLQFPVIWSHLLKKSLIENFFFCAVCHTSLMESKDVNCFRKKTPSLIFDRVLNTPLHCIINYTEQIKFTTLTAVRLRFAGAANFQFISVDNFSWIKPFSFSANNSQVTAWLLKFTKLHAVSLTHNIKHLVYSKSVVFLKTLPLYLLFSSTREKFACQNGRANVLLSHLSHLGI